MSEPLDAGQRAMSAHNEAIEVGVQERYSMGVDLLSCDGAAVQGSPHHPVVDPLKRRVALREYVRQLRGDNKENERGKECETEKEKVGCLPKQKTLGLCRRHVGAMAVAVSKGQGDGMVRDKRKFNAPRQTPEKRQRSDEPSLPLAMELPRLANQMVVEDGCEDAHGGMRQPLFQFASMKNVELEPINGADGSDVVTGARWSQLGGKDGLSPSPSRQTQLPDSYTLPFKWQAPEPKASPIRKPLAPVNIPVNRQAIELHSSSMDQVPLRPNFSGNLEHNVSVSNGSLFQTASGKPFQASAAAKARAALLFESDAELAEFFGLQL